MTALLEDTHGMGAVPLRVRLGLVRSGTLERARTAGLIGDSTGREERVRAGALLVLCGWASFMVAGAVFAKFSEHWDAVTPQSHRWLPNDGYTAVQWAGEVGGLLVLLAALVASPPFVRLIRSGGWITVRRSVLRALVVCGMAIAFTIALVAWAHHLSVHDRNGGLLGYGLMIVPWGMSVLAALITATTAAVSVARNVTFSRRTLKLMGWLAMTLTTLMVVVVAGTGVWWFEVADFSPKFLGGGPLATANVLPPPLVAAAFLMLAGLAAAAVGTIRIGRSSSPNRQY
ncbi:MAG TPA: hypothetical protein VMV06_05580 [Acidimicrobiales bacterium]|nr:hypothetical protein [Acidimicrobiales bacterium]HVB94736.1 hypothetical protein [Acidimicrobiales bacterium]